ncbi:AFR080Wp [Eremothecium gossypii ATCC 10895]|uniref:AFR080Wp n=1 Tax=Eremothecium gossypii (strain ATCC 10895 / CBS 109.51 / FGSC 9923 / NRRL Y-1056) TaxID=284811 RepID=Q754Y5_EREGS|nr:AFR080Wp [Eremothecium gossypii ATCC 10895]AAS53451.1 AFR080Wp [Eremothecium gossypii ATCC 10895]AEY97763.1 FAFR080Wp [Eremothecium gossypii FDAG1]
MNEAAATRYAVERIPMLVPLDEVSIKELCSSILTRANGNLEIVAEELLEILGHTSEAYEFVFRFNEALSGATGSTAGQSEADEKANRNASGRKLPIIMLNDTDITEDVVPDCPPEYDQEEAAEIAVSERLASHKTQGSKLHTLQEIDEALKALELRGSGSDGNASYKCNCQATMHPLFELAPNCLNCGKIICCREGLHMDSCSYCGTLLIPKQQQRDIEKVLQRERELVKAKRQETGSTGKKKEKVFKISNAKGRNMFSEQERLFDKLDRQREREMKRNQVLGAEDMSQEEDSILKAEEVDPELRAAQARLENLLHFQDTSEERTKIIDTASDYSMSNDAGIWGSAYEKAMALKRQQHNLRQWEKSERERNGRRDKIKLDLVLEKDGKVRFEESRVPGTRRGLTEDDIDELSDPDEREELQDIKELRKRINAEKQAEKESLLGNTWDFEKDKSRFRKPVYVGPGPADDDDSKQDLDSEETLQQHSRVQLDSADDKSVEESILAFL